MENTNFSYFYRTENSINENSISCNVGQKDVQVKWFVQRQRQFRDLDETDHCQNDGQTKYRYLSAGAQPKQIRSKIDVVLIII